MPQGLQVFNASGQSIQEVTDRITKLLGTVNTGGANGSITVSDFSQGTPFFYARANPSADSISINVTASGNTLSWAYGSIGGFGDAVNIDYGIY